MKSNETHPVCPGCAGIIPADAPRGLCPRCVLAGAATGGAAPFQGTATDDIPSLERVAADFPQLEIVELIGRGGMGVVYKARQPHLDRWVALKLLPDRLAQDPEFAERFNREGRFLARLNHPNIVSVYDFGRTSGFYYLTMEYVDGVNLRQAMQAGRFSPAEALSVVPKICAALQYAHEQGVLHRDIKPENILLDSKGGVKIADFGIAKLVGEDRAPITLTQTGSTLGTPHYMAPEQLEHPTGVDHRADIYSLGVVFYEMLTGELPIGRFEPPSATTPVGSGVDEVVLRTLQKDRNKRFQSAGEVKTEVERVAGDPGGLNRVAGPGSGERGPGGTLVMPPSGISRMAVVAASLVLLAVLLIGALLLVIIFFGGGIGAMELLALGVPAFTVGITGTVLGWISWIRIRASKGRLKGLPLAITASLCMPVFVVLALVATSLATGLMIRQSPPAQPPLTNNVPRPLPPPAPGYEPVGAVLRIPKEHVATVEILRQDIRQTKMVESFAGYALAPSDEPGIASMVLEPVPDSPGHWVMKIVSIEGSTSITGPAELGQLFPVSLPPMGTTLDITAGFDREIRFTNPVPAAQDDSTTTGSTLTLRVRGYHRDPGIPIRHTTVGGGTTNWAGGLRPPSP